MSIDRGYGIATSAVLADSYDLDALITDTEAAKVAAELAETNAGTSETNAATSAANASTSATNAATSETNASTSATAASASQTAAATSATNAATSETNAGTSATSASTSATNAATSETNAATSATNASTSETNAATSATSASTSATTATTQATNASTSATNAAASETAAATSATSASTSATTATTQATAASASATAASTSETNAATSATSASTSATNASTSETNAASSATAAQAAQAAAELAADNFDDTYLGAKASDPTLDNDGDALTAGDMYFNTTTDKMRVYDGAAWADTALTAADFVSVTGDTMTGDLNLGDNVKAQFGAGNDLQIYHDGVTGHSYIDENGSGSLYIDATNLQLRDHLDAKYIRCIQAGAVDLYHNGVSKLATTSTGVNVTGGGRTTLTTDNDGSFSMSASNNFKCTPAANFTLTFTNIASQSGFILLVNTGGHTVSAAATTKVDANMLATVSTAGTYLLSYFSDGTNVYMTNSLAYT